MNQNNILYTELSLHCFPFHYSTRAWKQSFNCPFDTPKTCPWLSRPPASSVKRHGKYLESGSIPIRVYAIHHRRRKQSHPVIVLRMTTQSQTRPPWNIHRCSIAVVVQQKTRNEPTVVHLMGSFRQRKKIIRHRTRIDPLCGAHRCAEI